MLKKLYGKSYQFYIWLRFKLVQRRRLNRPVLEEVEGIPTVVLPDVFNPTLVSVSEIFVKALNAEPDLNGRRVLDMGSGSGILGVAAARRGASVTALDLNPSAVRCTRINALLNDVSIDARQSDLFAAVAGETFDLILFNPPFFAGKPKSLLEMAFFSEGVVDGFIAQLQEYLGPGGCGLIAASNTKHMKGFHASLERHGFSWEVVAERREPSETYAVVRVRRAGT